VSVLDDFVILRVSKKDFSSTVTTHSR
jgi:hypothetical protein